MKTLSVVTEQDAPALIAKFQQDPGLALAYGRTNVFAIMQDRNLTSPAKQERVRRYIEAFMSLQVKLDRVAFPPSDTINEGVPGYIPDGLSDMGSDSRVDAGRTREKIRINKERIFAQAKQLFEEIYSLDITGKEPGAMKRYIASRVAHFVYTKMPYDSQNRDPFRWAQGKSVPVHQAMDERLAVCRHHALYTQVLLQAFGLHGQLLKCSVDFGQGSAGPHVANLVRADSAWYILDATNPDIEVGGENTFLKPIPETDIDINRKNYEWVVPHGKNGKYIYRPRNNMFYRIRDNRQPT
jgi:hypothetical protein